MFDTWLQSIAHADAADWVTVAFYLIAAILSGRAAGKAKVARLGSETWFWRAMAVTMAFLGVNELLDLQWVLTVIARDHAKANGWYEGRREVQYVFVFGLAALALGLGVAAVRLTWRMARSVQVAFVGLIFIGAFVLLRAASIHHIDELLATGLPVFNNGSIQELSGVAIVAAAAFLYPRERRRVAQRG